MVSEARPVHTLTAVIDTVVAGWASLHLFLTGNHHDKRHPVLLIADIDPETWIDQHLEGAKADPWKTETADARLPPIEVHRIGRDSAA